MDNVLLNRLSASPDVNFKLDILKFGLGPMIPNSIQDFVGPFEYNIVSEILKDPNRKAILDKLSWTVDNIKYRANDFGYRMNENFSDLMGDECSVYLGCSITFGIGLNIEDTWSWKHSQISGLRHVNLSWPGAGIETFYRLLKIWASVLNIKRVYTLGSFFGRREILSSKKPNFSQKRGNENTNAVMFGTRNKLWYTDKDTRPTSYSEMLLDPDDLEISYLRAWDAIIGICSLNNIELLMLDKKFIKSQNKNARDLIHPGPEWHSEIANLPDSAWNKITVQKS